MHPTCQFLFFVPEQLETYSERWYLSLYLKGFSLMIFFWISLVFLLMSPFSSLILLTWVVLPFF
jgi:hypothetical protein